MKKIIVDGMHCSSCSQLMASELEELGAYDVTIDIKTGEVCFSGELTEQQIAQAVASAGFTLRV